MLQPLTALFHYKEKEEEKKTIWYHARQRKEGDQVISLLLLYNYAVTGHISFYTLQGPCQHFELNSTLLVGMDHRRTDLY